MSKSIKLQNNTYIDSSSITYNKELLSVILKNYKSGTTRINPIANSYVRLFTFELSNIWKNASILFYLNDTQDLTFSQLVNFSVKKNNTNESLFLHTFKALNFTGNLTSSLVAVRTSMNVIEVYFKMSETQSPTINILAIAKLENKNSYGVLTIDCNTIVSTLPSGAKTFVTNLLQ